MRVLASPVAELLKVVLCDALSGGVVYKVDPGGRDANHEVLGDDSVGGCLDAGGHEKRPAIVLCPPDDVEVCLEGCVLVALGLHLELSQEEALPLVGRADDGRAGGCKRV